MQIANKEVNNIDEALSFLPEDQIAHSQRVARYCEIAFKGIVAKDTYVSVPRAQRELIAENSRLAYISGLYHDIGKVVPDGDHTANGINVIEALYPGWQELKAIERKLIADGIADHHERMNGLGGPVGKTDDSVSYMGRIVAIADLIDNRALSITSEDPISDALDSLKEEVKAGFLDDKFFKAFSANRAKLKKVFTESMGEDLPIPVTDQWIKRKASRPMELVYKTACKCGTLKTDPQNYIWFGEMRFRGTKENDLKYSDVKRIVSENKLGPKLGEYFIYELCDAYKRFKACGMDLGGAAMVLPAPYLSAKGIAGQIETILKDEGLTKEQLILVIPEEATKRPTKAFQKNAAECKERGINLMEEYEFLGFADLTEEVPFEKEEQIVRSQVRALQQQAKNEKRWDEELKTEG